MMMPSLVLEIDLYQLFKLLLLALVVGCLLEFALSVETVVKAFYGAEAASKAFEVRGKIRAFLMHA